MKSSSFDIDNGILIRYEGEEPYVTVPDGVTEIAARAFHNCRHMREVTLPDSLTCIRSEAFYLCAGLKQIIGGDRVERIERDAFAGTAWYKRYAGNETEWKPEEGVFKRIGRVLVRAKRNLRRADIPEGTVAIAAGAFADCTLMEEVRSRRLSNTSAGAPSRSACV